MALLSDDPVTEIDFVQCGARVVFDDGTNFEGVWSRFKVMQFGIWRALTIFAILLEDKLCFFLNGFGNLYFRSSFCSSNVTHSEKYTFCPAFFEHSMIQVESGILFDQRFCSCNRYRSRNQAPTMSRSRQVTSHHLVYFSKKQRTSTF